MRPVISRALRARPSTGSSWRSTSRDLSALAHVAWAGFLSTAQVERLLFPSRRVAQRRLRAALDMGLLRASLQSDALHEDNLHTLSREGRRLLERERVFEGPLPKSGFPRPAKRAHALLVRDVFAEFLMSERDGLGLVHDLKFDRDLAVVEPFRSERLIPDLLAELEVNGRLVVGVECDLGTEPLRVFAAKLTRWRFVLERRGVHELLVVAEPERRQRRLRSLLVEAHLARSQVVGRADVGAWIRTALEVRGVGVFREVSEGGHGRRDLVQSRPEPSVNGHVDLSVSDASAKDG